MNIHPSNIGFDIDCVVADTMSAFIDLAGKDYGVSILPEEITEFQVEECLQLKQEIIEEIFGRLLENPLKNGLQPMPNAVSVLTDMAEYGPLTFITARPTKDPIAMWLHSILGPDVYDQVRLTATGNHDGKASFIKDADIDYFIDDRVPTCIELANEGLNPIVFSQPWNRGKHELPSVDSWLSIKKLCLP